MTINEMLGFVPQPNLRMTNDKGQRTTSQLDEMLGFVPQPNLRMTNDE
ncbi:hypothetical protein [Scytonema sp. NUACC21]